MLHKKQATQRIKTIRWLARILGVLVVIFWILKILDPQSGDLQQVAPVDAFLLSLTGLARAFGRLAAAGTGPERLVADAFRAPACRWCPGHRGLQFRVVPGHAVRAVSTGTVSYTHLTLPTIYSL